LTPSEHCLIEWVTIEPNIYGGSVKTGTPSIALPDEKTPPSVEADGGIFKFTAVYYFYYPA
jgi:hypothetical protein